MRRLTQSSQFTKDLKKVKRSGACSFDNIQEIVSLLLEDIPLPPHCRDHALSGSWKTIHARDCHIKPDVILIYAKSPDEVSLLRIGSHAELFNL